MRKGFGKDEKIMLIFFDMEKAYDKAWRCGIMQTYMQLA